MATVPAPRTLTPALAPLDTVRRLWLIANLTFSEAVRKRMVWAVILLSAIYLALYGWGVVRFKETFESTASRAAQLGRLLRYEQQIDLLVAFGMFVVFFLAGVMGIFASIGTIAGEVDAGTFQAVLPKPIRRWEVVIGKFLGFALMLALYVGLMTLVIGVMVRFITGYAPATLPQGAAIIVLSSWWLLALTVLGSTIFATMANGIVVYMLYAFSLAATILETIGQTLAIEAMETAGLVGSIILPSQRVYNYANYLLQPSTNLAFGGGGGLGAAPPSAAIVPFTAGYLVVLLVAACLVFRRKDL